MKKYVIQVDEYYVQINGYNISYVNEDSEATKFDSLQTLVSEAERLQISGYEAQKI